MAVAQTDSLLVKRRTILLNVAAAASTALIAACGGNPPSSGSNTGAQGTGAALVQSANATATALNSTGSKTGSNNTGSSQITSPTSVTVTQQATKGGLQGYVYIGDLPDSATGDSAIPNPWGLWFIQWTQGSGGLTGQAQTTFTINDHPEVGVSARSFALQGTRDGKNVSMVVQYDFQKRTLSGVLDNDGLTLFVPTPSGQNTPFTFVPTSTQDYDAAVQQLKGQVEQLLAQKQATATAIPAATVAALGNIIFGLWTASPPVTLSVGGSDTKVAVPQLEFLADGAVNFPGTTIRQGKYRFVEQGDQYYFVFLNPGRTSVETGEVAQVGLRMRWDGTKFALDGQQGVILTRQM